MADLVLGPMLRFVDETSATVWVETDARCEVEVLGRRERTFRIGAHHYAIVAVEGLEPGGTHPYEVALDGERRWPLPDGDLPPSVIRTFRPDDRLDLVFGSCRTAMPHHPPYTLTKDEHPDGREIDALYGLAHRMTQLPPHEWPDVLLMIGDQVYADLDAPATREFIRRRRDTGAPPYEDVADFEEYTRLYRESWGDRTIRWLFSTLPTSMIFDDHDVADDWNISASWLADVEATDWWESRITGALMGFWLYQHLGNLPPALLRDDPLLARLRELEDGEAELRASVLRERGPEGSRWSWSRQLGRVKIVVLDGRAGRVLEEERRDMQTPEEWAWVEREITGDFDHLVIADPLPTFLVHGLHWLEQWNERVCGGAWGPAAADLGEKVRRAVDLEHWPAWHRGFDHLVRLMTEVASGQHGAPPATIVKLGGDVHHAYLAEVALPRAAGARSAVFQAVCSPFRNPLDARERAVIRFAASKPFTAFARALARAAGARDPAARWRLVGSPTFDNQVAWLAFRGRRASMRIDRTIPGNWRRPRMTTTLNHRLA